jgi:hypothetical protein
MLRQLHCTILAVVLTRAFGELKPPQVPIWTPVRQPVSE